MGPFRDLPPFFFLLYFFSYSRLCLYVQSRPVYQVYIVYKYPITYNIRRGSPFTEYIRLLNSIQWISDVRLYIFNILSCKKKKSYRIYYWTIMYTNGVGITFTVSNVYPRGVVVCSLMLQRWWATMLLGIYIYIYIFT